MESLGNFFYKTNYKMISLVNLTVNKLMKPIAEKCLIFFYKLISKLILP